MFPTRPPPTEHFSLRPYLGRYLSSPEGVGGLESFILSGMFPLIKAAAPPSITFPYPLLLLDIVTLATSCFGLHSFLTFLCLPYHEPNDRHVILVSHCLPTSSRPRSDLCASAHHCTTSQQLAEMPSLPAQPRSWARITTTVPRNSLPLFLHAPLSTQIIR